MGAGIAYVAARGGYAVELIEPDAAARERAMARIAKDAARAGDDGVLARIIAREAIPANSAAAIAIEAVPERLDLKRTIFAALDAALDPQAILATNTSSLSVAELARTTSAPQRVVGLHFFNPPAAMKFVEIVETEASSRKRSIAHTRSSNASARPASFVPIRPASSSIASRVHSICNRCVRSNARSLRSKNSMRWRAASDFAWVPSN